MLSFCKIENLGIDFCSSQVVSHCDIHTYTRSYTHALTLTWSRSAGKRGLGDSTKREVKVNSQKVPLLCYTVQSVSNHF